MPKLTTAAIKDQLAKKFGAFPKEFKRVSKRKEQRKTVRVFEFCQEKLTVISDDADEVIEQIVEQDGLVRSGTFTPANWYFAVQHDPHYPAEDCFVFCPKSYWDKYKRGYDQEDEELEEFLEPHSFYPLQEGVFEYASQATMKPLDLMTGKALLLQLGFIENGALLN